MAARAIFSCGIDLFNVGIIFTKNFLLLYVVTSLHSFAASAKRCRTLFPNKVDKQKAIWRRHRRLSSGRNGRSRSPYPPDRSGW
jgi:hypothetical protein